MGRDDDVPPGMFGRQILDRRADANNRIGSEGTLGVIVEATLRLDGPPEASAVMLVGTPDMAAIMDVLRGSRDVLTLSAFEFFSEPALQKVIALRDLQRPFSKLY